jgi:ribosomal protein S18 acetylase RimI-like enzyme
MDVEIRALGPGDDVAVLAAGALFDGPPSAAATRRFLADPTHHLLVAYDAGGAPVGFVSGVETTHPDKGVEMFLYELGVAETARRRGIGRALGQALGELAREQECHSMWVAVDADNEAALATYASAGAAATPAVVLREWRLAAG